MLISKVIPRFRRFGQSFGKRRVSLRREMRPVKSERNVPRAGVGKGDAQLARKLAVPESPKHITRFISRASLQRA